MKQIKLTGEAAEIAMNLDNNPALCKLIKEASGLNKTDLNALLQTIRNGRRRKTWKNC